MRCRRVKDRLALLAGGDLPERKIPALRSHLDRCPDCAAAYEALKRALTVVSEMAQKEIPPPLPVNFSDQVLGEAVKRTGKKPGEEAYRPRFLTWKPAAAFGGIALVMLLIFGIPKIFRENRVKTEPASMAASRQAKNSGISAPHWTLKHPMSAPFKGPFRLAYWKPPKASGVYAIMHKEDPANKPDTYTLDYCGETSNMASYRGYPWIRQREKRMITMAGSKDNLYIAVRLMPGSSRRERHKMEEKIIETFQPHFNQGV